MIAIKNTLAIMKLIITLVIIVTLSSCGGGGSESTPAPSTPVPPSNVAPIVNAGSDQTVDEQILVHLGGTATDSDGSIASYAWSQVSGVPVKIHSFDSAEISFDGPAASKQIILSFQLIVIDNMGATASDTVDIIVNPVLPLNVEIWNPSLITDCVVDDNVSPVLSSVADTLSEVGQTLFEPAIIFADQTFTWLVKGEIGASSMSSTLLDSGGYDVVDDDDKSLVFDDGSHGDLVAGDGIFTRSCVFAATSDLSIKPSYELSGLWVLNESLRNSETATYIAKGVRVNNAGFFIELGETYQQRFTFFQNISYIGNCKACAVAWQLAGDVFDFFVLSTRDGIGGAGYTRVHDNILGTGFNPPCESRSYCYNIIDGQEHQKLTGIITMQWPGIQGMNHELGHGFLGTETRDFPGVGDRAWNAGDLFHLDSDITVTGELSGPFWDPIRGYPYSVQLENAQSERIEVYLTKDDNGIFRLKEIGDDRQVWDDILLYMMGLIESEEVTKTYHKLLNPSLDNCIAEENHTICTSDLVTADEIIPFTVDDFIAQFGTRSILSFIDPKQIQMGVLNISDRPHTDAEIVWHTKVYLDFVTATEPTGQWSVGTTWSWATKGLSTININAEALIQQ